jgi:hypothetical protein
VSPVFNLAQETFNLRETVEEVAAQAVSEYNHNLTQMYHDYLESKEKNHESQPTP